MNDKDNFTEGIDNWTTGVRTLQTEITTNVTTHVAADVGDHCPITSGRPSKNTYLTGITLRIPLKADKSVYITKMRAMKSFRHISSGTVHFVLGRKLVCPE